MGWLNSDADSQDGGPVVDLSRRTVRIERAYWWSPPDHSQGWSCWAEDIHGNRWVHYKKQCNSEEEYWAGQGFAERVSARGYINKAHWCLVDKALVEEWDRMIREQQNNASLVIEDDEWAREILSRTDEHESAYTYEEPYHDDLGGGGYMDSVYDLQDFLESTHIDDQ